MQTLIIHGRQPALGRAELESLYGAEKIQSVGEVATVLDIEPKEIDFMRLGGMVKFCKVLTVLDATDWNKIEDFLVKTTPQHFSSLPEGKLKLGLSVYGIKANTKRIQATALEIKKVGKQANRSIRVIPNKNPALNAAAVLHNKLTQKLGWELVFVRDGNKTIVAQSIAVQDIDKYAARDQKRPYRDSKVGMLPPKLAQIIINLAIGTWDPEGNRNPLNEPEKGPAKSVELLDPFCGTGVILQEALLMGCIVLGSDIDERMAEYTNRNLEWLGTGHKGTFTTGAFVADATSHIWKAYFDFIACETYLGRPFSSQPDAKTLEKVIQDCDTIHKKFLRNVARQTKSGFRMCIAVPAWKTKTNFKHLPTLDKLEDLGYNRLSFVHAGRDDLIYHRPGQIVGRELVVLERK